MAIAQCRSTSFPGGSRGKGSGPHCPCPSSAGNFSGAPDQIPLCTVCESGISRMDSLLVPKPRLDPRFELRVVNGVSVIALTSDPRPKVAPTVAPAAAASSAAPSASSAAAASSAAPSGAGDSARHYTPSSLSLEERYDLCRSVGEECIQEEELRTLLKVKPHPICYDGFEPSGRMHIAQGGFASMLAFACCVNAGLSLRARHP